MARCCVWLPVFITCLSVCSVRYMFVNNITGKQSHLSSWNFQNRWAMAGGSYRYICQVTTPCNGVQGQDIRQQSQLWQAIRPVVNVRLMVPFGLPSQITRLFLDFSRSSVFKNLFSVVLFGPFGRLSWLHISFEYPLKLVAYRNVENMPLYSISASTETTFSFFLFFSYGRHTPALRPASQAGPCATPGMGLM